MKFNLLNYLTEDIPATSNLIIIYPGRFQPAHKNHAKVYNFLVQKFPYASVFIATSNKINPPNSPFTYNEKKIMLTAAGVPEAAIQECTNVYSATEITNKFDSSSSKLIFAVGGKDMQQTPTSKPRFSFKPTTKGDPYFQPLPAILNLTNKSLNKLLTFNQHGYVATMPTYSFSLKIAGNKIPIQGASEIREIYKNASVNTRRDIIKQLYTDFSEEIYNIFNKRLI